MDTPCHKLPKKEQNLNMSAPPPRAQETSRLATRAERDDEMDPEARTNFIRLADDALRN